MPMAAHPPRNPTSPFASLGGHHVGIRLACLCPPDDDEFHVELLAGPVHVDDVDAARAELAKRGVDLGGEPFEIEPVSRRLAFSGQAPAGNADAPTSTQDMGASRRP
ncbi:VOC family protein [Streptomyces sp. CA-249302]|uniref:VOC family protein n=1 Tax=Streptomyces sp. CA-249302 TaxID=3240058 RepID=UPI003D8F80A0